jgi:hypothetical protein
MKKKSHCLHKQGDPGGCRKKMSDLHVAGTAAHATAPRNKANALVQFTAKCRTCKEQLFCFAVVRGLWSHAARFREQREENYLVQWLQQERGSWRHPPLRKDVRRLQSQAGHLA